MCLYDEVHRPVALHEALLCVLAFLLNPCATVHLNRVYTRPTHKLIWDMCAQLRMVGYATSLKLGTVVCELVMYNFIVSLEGCIKFKSRY
jgi:hypothetical protein